jgi:carbamoyltransferase
MYILGYSGLHHSDVYHKKKLESFGVTDDDNNFQGMDAAVTIICDGNVIAAAEEERFTNEKHINHFPINAITNCLEQAGIDIDSVDFICHGFNYQNYAKYFENSEAAEDFYKNVANPLLQEQLWAEYFPNSELRHKFTPIEHHAAHAASAFFPSPFEEALTVVIDGMGEINSISIYHGKDSELKPLKTYDFSRSIGMFYGLMTMHLGFKINSGEYKVMGLAPYGDPTRYKSFMDECIVLHDKGKVMVNALFHDVSDEQRLTHSGFFSWVAEKTLPRRQPESEMSQEYMDLAAALQIRLNEAILHLMQYWRAETGLKNLCYAGGVALNCTANGVLLRKNIFDDIYIQPAAGDAGTSLGAALYQYHHVSSLPRVPAKYQLPLYGPSWTDDEVLALAERFQGKITAKKVSDEELYKNAAKLISTGNVIAWVQGNMEFGPRALGNRSILADVRDPNMRAKVNKLVKKREGFRPFAPSVKRSAAITYFDIRPNQSFPYMLFTVPVRVEYQEKLPAITHINGTARVQTVDEEHIRYWKLLDAFEKLTGLPMLLNTSFNLRGQAMVCSPDVAISTFLETEIDELFVGNIQITKL